MDENEYLLSKICGLCSQEVWNEDIPYHECLQDFNNFLVKENIFYPIDMFNWSLTYFQSAQRILLGFYIIKDPKEDSLSDNNMIKEQPTCSNEQTSSKNNTLQGQSCSYKETLCNIGALEGPLCSYEQTLSNIGALEGPSCSYNTSNEVNRKRQIPATSSLPNKKRRMNFDDEELLILAVEKRSPLWDFSLPLKERNSITKRKLWNEVAKEFNGKYDAELLKTKFKSLHDTFRKIVQSENCPSGSSRKEMNRKWGHYSSMQFLRDSCLVKTTVSNLGNTSQEVLDNDPVTDDEENVCVSETANSSKTRMKNKKAETNTMSILERIANSFSQNAEIRLPPPPEPDEVDSFLLLVGSRIRRLSPSEQLDTMQEILDLTFRKLKK